MRKILWVLAAILVLVFSLPFASSEEKPYCSFVDASGNTVELFEKPQRTAVLFSSFADMWVSAGGEIAVTVGDSVIRGFAGEETPLVDKGMGKTIHLEELISLKPDFVICNADIPAQAETAELLRQQGINAAVFHVDTYQEYLATLQQMTMVTGNTEAYEKYGLSQQPRISAVIENSNAQGKRVLFVRAGSTDSATKAKGTKDHFVCVMLNEMGCINMADEGSFVDGLNMETILMQDPDYIFFALMGKEGAARTHVEEMLQEPAWQALTAVKEGRVEILPKDLFHYKPNERWAEAYEYLSSIFEEDAEDEAN